MVHGIIILQKKSKARMYARVLPKLEPEAKDYEIQRVDSSSWNGSAITEQTAKPRSIKHAASAKNISGRVTTLLSDVYASAKPQLLQTASGKKLLILQRTWAAEQQGIIQQWYILFIMNKMGGVYLR